MILKAGCMTAVTSGPASRKAKGSLPWLPNNHVLPTMTTLHNQVMDQTPVNTTQRVLVGGVLFSVVAAIYCLWSKMGKPLPWMPAASPSRRRSARGHSRQAPFRHQV